jgi:hypothetical protein
MDEFELEKRYFENYWLTPFSNLQIHISSIHLAISSVFE